MKSFFSSFAFAWNGIKEAIRGKGNILFHVFAFLVVLGLGWFFHISKSEWCTLIISSALVISAEIFNTAIELLCDFVHPNLHPSIKRIKDMAAGAVLILAIGAAFVGLIIFLPYIK